MQKTPNLNLNKPDGTDVVNIEDLNANMDIIDSKLGTINAHIQNTSNPHNTTAAQVGAVAINDARLTDARPANGGTASYTEYVNNDNTAMRFHWSGLGGQPSWLWGGGNAPGDMYVYNPSNFHVNRADYADSAGNADTVDGYHASQLLSSFDAGHSFTANGWQKLSNGLILQWGYGSLPTGGITNVTFPIAFPTNVLGVYPTISLSATGGNRYAIWSSNESKTGFTCVNSSSTGAENFYWFAIGN